jgi:hypothetical protein
VFQVDEGTLVDEETLVVGEILVFEHDVSLIIFQQELANQVGIVVAERTIFQNGGTLFCHRFHYFVIDK